MGLNPALQGNLKMIRHMAGSGPLYIRSMLDIKNLKMIPQVMRTQIFQIMNVKM